MSRETQRLEVKIRPANFPDDFEVVRELFLAYAESLPVNLDFQNFEQELAGLPGKYAVENGGAVYLAFTTSAPSKPATTIARNDSRATQETSRQEQAIGCIGLRAFPTTNDIQTCELKRLYLTPESRGLGVSKLLLDVVLAQARQLGYQEMLLDTLESMIAARKLYEKYGFEEIESYYDSCDGAVFYKLKL